MDWKKEDGNKEDPLEVEEEDAVKSTVEKMRALAKEFIIHYVDDKFVAQLKSALRSDQMLPPPHFKSQPMNAPPPQSKITELVYCVVQDILQSISPTKEDSVTRADIITDLRDVLKGGNVLKGVTLEPYGSFVSNLHTRSSDMDLSLFTGSTILPTNKVEAQNVLSQVYTAMRMSDLSSKELYIGNARVPIVKANINQIPCDISLNNVKGLLKSRFLLWISGIDYRFRDLVLLVKTWAKSNGINNSRDGSFNSYTLCLLVIFHLQTCLPAILPPLQEFYPRNASGDLKGERRQAEESIEKIAATNIARFRSASTSNTSSITDLLLSFFEKFSDIHLKATEFAVCTYTGSWESITDNRRWFLPTKDLLFVEDPFDQPENAARGVWQLKKIANVFETSSRKLGSVTNREDIVRLLTGPQY